MSQQGDGRLVPAEPVSEPIGPGGLPTLTIHFAAGGCGKGALLTRLAGGNGLFDQTSPPGSIRCSMTGSNDNDSKECGTIRGFIYRCYWIMLAAVASTCWVALV